MREPGMRFKPRDTSCRMRAPYAASSTNVATLTAGASNIRDPLCGRTTPDHPPRRQPSAPVRFSQRRRRGPARIGYREAYVRRLLTWLCLQNRISSCVGEAKIKADINPLTNLTTTPLQSSTTDGSRENVCVYLCNIKISIYFADTRTAQSSSFLCHFTNIVSNFLLNIFF